MLSDLNLNMLQTPSLVYDENLLIQMVKRLVSIRENHGCKILFSLKSFAIIDALRLIAPMLNGFASSSLFEATLARDVSSKGTIHITTPSLKVDEIDNIAEICNYINFNSLSQLDKLRKAVGNRAYCGLRVNPQLSFVRDRRYDPCRKNSKLGVPLDALVKTLSDHSLASGNISGLHFHTNCESKSLEPLLKTVEYLDLRLSDFLKNLDWINLGGGYQYDEVTTIEPLIQAIELLKQKYKLEVFIEPGEAIVGNAGYIISSVVDLFDSEGKTIAILDTSVNHMPQVYEYQYNPNISGATSSGKYNYLLGGATCLAGDIFGEYKFDAPLEIGSKIIFEFMGAYTLVKAHMFNGVNLPSIYALNSENELVLKRQYTYQDYVSRLI